MKGKMQNMEEPEEDRGDRRQAGWVLLVVACGVAVGGLLWLLHPISPGTAPIPSPPPTGGPIGSANLGRIAGVFSMVDLALIVALIVVYVRTYIDTRAKFALGLVLFLVALALQSTSLSLPLIVALGFGWGGLGVFFLLSALFESLALAVFLYLSLK